MTTLPALRPDDQDQRIEAELAEIATLLGSEQDPMRRRDLWLRMDELVHLKSARKPVNEPRPQDPARVFEHYCHCGAWGAFGYGPPMRPVLEWYCAAHRPDGSSGQGVADASRVRRIDGAVTNTAGEFVAAAFPDLQEWVRKHGGYGRIPWDEWDAAVEKAREDHRTLLAMEKAEAQRIREGRR
jgi:hypothetical protein